MSTAGGAEFLFWILFISFMLGIFGIYGFYTTIIRMQNAERDNLKLRIEVVRCRSWLRIKPENWSWDDQLKRLYDEPIF